MIPDRNTLIIESSGEEQEIGYDSIVFCTGLTFDEPVNTESALTKEERERYLNS